MAIKTGDLVWTKSPDSPSMTVGTKMTGGKWTCNWFVDSKPFEKTFHEAELTTTPPAQNKGIFNG